MREPSGRETLTIAGGAGGAMAACAIHLVLLAGAAGTLAGIGGAPLNLYLLAPAVLLALASLGVVLARPRRVHNCVSGPPKPAGSTVAATIGPRRGHMRDHVS